MRQTTKLRFLNFFRNVFKVPVLENQLRKLTEGKSSRHFFGKLVANSYQYPPDSIRNVIRNGIFLQLDISDYVGHYIYFGFTDPSIQRLLSLCNKNFYIVDVGANLGWTMLNMAAIATEGAVIGFEPDAYNFQQCQKNLSRNNFKNVWILNLGLGSARSVARMEERNKANRGENRISNFSNQRGAEVTIERLDDVSEIQSLPRIDLIKIDVEGYELQVLRGAEFHLKKFRPILFIELDDNNLKEQNDSAKLLVGFLKEIGYQDIRIAETGQNLLSTDNFDNCHFDIIAR